MENNLYISSCGVGAPSTQRWHLNQDIEIQRLYYILGGSGGYYDIGGQLHMFQVGHLYLFPYNIRHRFTNDTANPVRHLYFDFLSTPPVIAPDPLSQRVEENTDLKDALALAVQLFSSRPRSALIESPLGKNTLALLLALFDEIMPLPFHTDEIICRSLETIQKDYNTPITVRSLAAQAGFEENYFIRRFRNTMHQTPYAYLRNYRLMQAKNFLRAGLSTEETAAKVGYASASALIRALRQLKTL